MAEDADSGVAVGHVSATVADANDRLTYAFTSDGNPNDLFAIDSKSGVITLAGTLDYETANTHRLTVSASDGTNMATTTVTILVTDYIGDAPVFSQAVSGFFVSEDVSIDSGIALVYTLGDAKDLTYSIIEGNVDNLFTIVGFSEAVILGVITDGAVIILNRSLDYETTPRYVLTIQASDGTNTATTVVRIALDDVNEYAPMFDASSYAAEVAENAASGSVITVVKATDADGWALRNYAITGGNSDNLFTIDAKTGAVTFTGNSDLTADDTHNLTIEVSDGKHTASTAALVVTVTAPANLPKFKKPLHSIRLDEDTPVGATVTSVEATSTNSATPLTYKIIDGNDAGHFTIIDAASGEITLANALDYETTDSSRASRYDVRHVLTIEASDGVNTAITLVTVTVGNANEAPVFDQPSYAIELAEDAVSGTKVIGVSATDEDYQDTHINYAITGGNSDNLFTIDTMTGIITLIGTLDTESATTHILTVEVSSGYRHIPSRSKSATTTVTVEVLDVIKPAPVFDVALYTPTIAENAATGSFVTWVHASDADANDTLTYSIISGNSNKLFAIEDHNGIFGRITLKGALDDEIATSHTLTVQVSDGSNTATTQVVISLEDVNEHSPTFASDAVAWETAFADGVVLENTSTGTKLATITATDADGMANLSYKLLGDAGPFALSKSGVLTLNGALDFETTSSYTLTVQASDGINNTTKNITISVDDVSEITISGSNADNTDSDLANLAVGWTLTARVETLDTDGVDASTLSYRWFYANNPDGNIGTGTTYQVKGADKGEYIGVELSYTDVTGTATKVFTKLATTVPRTVVKPEPDTTSGETEAVAAARDNVISVPADQASHVQAGDGADSIKDGNRNDVIIGGLGDDVIDLGGDSDGTDTDQVIYRIGEQTAADGGDRITNFNRGKDQFTFSLESNAETDKIKNYEDFLNYVNSGTPRVVKDDQFLVLLDIDYFAPTLTLEGLYLHFKDSSFFSDGRISMPLVNIKFAEGLTGDEFLKVFGENVDISDVIDVNGLLRDLSYLDDLLGGEGSVSYEVV